MTETKERREHPRFRVTDGAFAFIDNILFSIHNISQCGIQLQSVVYDGTPTEEMLLDIFFKHDNFYLQDVPVRLVRFQKSSPSTPFSNAHVKCIGLQFGELTQQQKSRIDYFIAHNTTGES